MAKRPVRIIPNKKRVVQVQETRRKLFNTEAKLEFLDHFAATCNAAQSARAAGFSDNVAYRHRANDPEFAAKWDEALRYGYRRLEELALSEAIVALDWQPCDAPERPPESLKLDPAMALQLLREHKRGLAGIPKPGRTPGAASNKEVIEALTKRLRAYGVNVGRRSKRK